MESEQDSQTVEEPAATPATTTPPVPTTTAEDVTGTEGGDGCGEDNYETATTAASDSVPAQDREAVAAPVETPPVSSTDAEEITAANGDGEIDKFNEEIGEDNGKGEDTNVDSAKPDTDIVDKNTPKDVAMEADIEKKEESTTDEFGNSGADETVNSQKETTSVPKAEEEQSEPPETTEGECKDVIHAVDSGKNSSPTPETEEVHSKVKDSKTDIVDSVTEINDSIPDTPKEGLEKPEASAPESSKPATCSDEKNQPENAKTADVPIAPESSKPIDCSDEKNQPENAKTADVPIAPESSKPINCSDEKNQPENAKTADAPVGTSVPRPGESLTPNKAPKPRCPKCNRSVRDQAALESHVCEKEAEDEVKVKVTISANKEKATFTCNDCNFTGGERPFSEHLMCHLMLRPYQCLHCKECFINRKETSVHVHKAHNGAKLSCALSTPRALRKAKALIKEASNSGIISFMARIGAKVPLEKDPERPALTAVACKEIQEEKKKETEAKSSAQTNGDKVDQTNSEKVDQTNGEKVDQTNGEKMDETFDKATGNQNEKHDKEEEGGEEISEHESNSTNPGTGFSKLREALTSSSTSASAPNHDNSETNAVDSGPKILASYSLKDGDDAQDTVTDGNQTAAQKETESTVLETESNGDKADHPPEIMSFLGPEQPMYKPMDENNGPLLAPPPLIPAPTSSGDAYFPPPPELSSSATPGPGSTQSSVSSQPPKKNPNFFVCGFNCLFSSMNADDFLEHTTNFHSGETFYPCYYCGHRSANERDLVRHVSNHTHAHNNASPLYVCGNDGCRFGTNMVNDYINHIRTTHPEIARPLCYSCGDRFQDLQSLQRHAEENVIHIVNCPHCPSKATERRPILTHISTAHPGKPKMVSVAKQLICHDRKLNDYAEMKSFREMQPPTLTPAPSLTSVTPGSGSSSSSVVDQILSRHDLSSGGSTLSDILTGRASVSPGRSSVALTSPASRPSTGNTPSTASSPDLSTVVVKNEVEEVEEEEEDCFGLSRRPVGSPEECSSNYVIDELGVRRRIYVPMSERQAENFKCRHCTFIARDFKRLHCHERSHGMPPTRKDRFKCMFCPQGFDSEMKFRLHITCHPGTIRFLLYRCNKCEFDTNKKETIVKHITCNRDRKHRGTGPVEAQYSTVSRYLVSRVLLCEKCDYMTRHKIHMAIHYQRAHSILRDKSDFVIEGLTPIDTPVSSFEEERDDEELELTSDATASLHLQAALKSSPSHTASNGGTGATADDFDFPRPTSSAKRARDRDRGANPDQPVLTVEQINERNDLFIKMVAQHEALLPPRVKENQVRKFKCPICEYLLPKAADLKNHVKRHSEIGQITLTMFRCKYCSCMSTARTLLYEHLGEKHPGKPIALVKKIVAIDTAEVDKSFAETSVEENLDQLEEALHQDIMALLNKREEAESVGGGDKPSRSSFEQLFVIPAGGERFEVPLQCPRCPFSSHEKVEIIGHVNGLHPEVKVIGSDEDVDKLARETKEELQQQREAAGGSKPSSSLAGTSASGSSNTDSSSEVTSHLSGVPCQEDVLIVPDEPVFKEEALCSRCNFTTFLRKDMVTHLQRHHPDISVMGRNSYPMQVASLGRKPGDELHAAQHQHAMDSCIVGSGSLDAKIGCLYQNYGTQMRCLICGTDRPKKFFIHVHILRHLNIYLWKCAFCAHRGLQKYKMVDHIKKIHPGKAMSVRYLRVNVEAKVRQFLQQFDISTGEPRIAIEGDEGGGGDDRSSGTVSPWPGRQEEGSPSETSSMHEDDQLVAGTVATSASGVAAPLYTLGSESLDEKINCLFDFSDGVFYKCLACPNQFQRRFAIHRHVVMSHLKTNLLKCAHCPMESVERHLLIDHSLACHSQLPISIVALDLDLTQVVSDFLNRLAAGDLPGNSTETDQSEINDIMNGLTADDSDSLASASEQAENYYNRFYSSANRGRHKFPAIAASPRKYNRGKGGGRGSGGGFRFGAAGSRSGPRPSGSGHKKSASQVDPDVIMLGRDALDRELRCLYQPRPNGTLRCLVCRWEFPRKYPLHRHMMLKHLRMMLVGCPYCPFQGVEKYNVSSHIKEEHPDQPINIKYVSPDVRARVKEFVDDMAMSGGERFRADLIKKPSSRDRSSSKMAASSTSSPSRLVIPKLEKKDGDEEDEKEEEENGGEEDEETEEGDEGKKSPAVGGLVVAMFGKKKAKPQLSSETDGEDTVKVKAEIEDDGYNDNDAPAKDDAFDDEDAATYESHQKEGSDEEEEEGTGEEVPEGDGGEEGAGEVRLSLKRPLMESYAPGAYRSPVGGKPKALDVITNIKVLKTREAGSTKFYCELCKFTSLHRSNIVRHIYKIHEKYQTHTCPVCNYQTLSLLLMEGHMEKSHPGVEYSEDSFTLNPPRSKPRFTPSANYNVVGGARPLLGPLSFQKRRQDMIAELDASKNSSKGPKQFACAYCHYETNTQEDILQHTRDCHSSGEGSAAATTSPSRSKPSASACWDGSKKAIKRSLSPGSTSPYSASKAAFRQPSLPKRKKRFVFEKGDELIHCLDCSTRETSMGRMEDHCAFEHPGQPMRVKRIPAWRFVCKSCAVKTMATSKMKYHLNRHVNYRPYTCTNCGAFFPSPDQCRRHSRSQGHDDQYTYVRVAKKESRVEELLSQARELALKIQAEAVKDPDFDIAKTDEFITRFQETRTSLKRSAPHGSVKRMREIAAEMEAEGTQAGGGEAGEESVSRPSPSKRQAMKSSGLSGLLDTHPENVTIQCHTCGEYTAPTVHLAREHHRACHPGRKFLWRETERGFVCDASGEALPEYDAVPSDSTDVGYTTKMTLGSGASPLRFKCKSCDFSSSVIQAMKSHLKSHQPKGFMCPYCSRSFSGKEKLGRHQLCLHPTYPQWIIHLRRGTASSSAAASGAGTSATSSAFHSTRSKGDAGAEGEMSTMKKQTARRTGPKASAGYHDDDTVFLCPDCDFSSSSLYHFRRHLANQHAEAYSRHVYREPASEDSPLTCGYCSFPAETEAEFSAHLESHFAARTRQCAHCDYSAYDRNSVLRHIAAKHPGQEAKVVEIAGPSMSARGSGEGAVSNAVGVPLVLDMAPSVSVGRLSDEEMEKFGCSFSSSLEGDEDGEEGGENDFSQELNGELTGEVEDEEAKAEKGDNDEDDDQEEEGEDEGEEEEEEGEDEEEEAALVSTAEENMSVAEDTSDFINDEEEEEDVADEEEEGVGEEEGIEEEEEEEEELAEEEEGGEQTGLCEQINGKEEEEQEVEREDEEENVASKSDNELETEDTKEPSPEELARQLGLVSDEETTKPKQGSRSPSDTVILQFEGLKSGNGVTRNPAHNNVGTAEGLKERKDATLLSAQIDDDKDNDNEDDDDDDEDDDDDVDTVTFDTDITLASPLPMISLGDGVALSPVNMDSPPQEARDAEMLLDV